MSEDQEDNDGLEQSKNVTGNKRDVNAFCTDGGGSPLLSAVSGLKFP
jgi:hypothetical protein